MDLSCACGSLWLPQSDQVVRSGRNHSYSKLYWDQTVIRFLSPSDFLPLKKFPTSFWPFRPLVPFREVWAQLNGPNERRTSNEDKSVTERRRCSRDSCGIDRDSVGRTAGATRYRNRSGSAV